MNVPELHNSLDELDESLIVLGASFHCQTSLISATSSTSMMKSAQTACFRESQSTGCERFAKAPRKLPIRYSVAKAFAKVEFPIIPMENASLRKKTQKPTHTFCKGQHAGRESFARAPVKANQDFPGLYKKYQSIGRFRSRSIGKWVNKAYITRQGVKRQMYKPSQLPQSKGGSFGRNQKAFTQLRSYNRGYETLSDKFLRQVLSEFVSRFRTTVDSSFCMSQTPPANPARTSWEDTSRKFGSRRHTRMQANIPA